MDIYLGEVVEGQHSTRSAGKLGEDANTSVFKGCQGRLQSQTTLSSKPGFSKKVSTDLHRILPPSCGEVHKI